MDDISPITNSGVFWLTLALVNAGLAETKGRPRLRWFLISLVIGPLATALIVVWPRVTGPAPERLHPIYRVRDRFLFGATVAMLTFAAAVLVAIEAGTTGSTAVLSVALVTGLVSVAVFVLAMRGYGRHAPGVPTIETQPEPEPDPRTRL